MKKQKLSCIQSFGFTLIELLIVIAIFLFAGSIAVTILVTSLRTSTKTTLIIAAKENGNFALTQMVNTIRYATNVQCVSSTSIKTTSINNTQTTFDCSSNTINANGSSLLNTSAVALVANSCTISCTQVVTGNQIVQISFSLKASSASQVSERSFSPLQFSTSVDVRNLDR